MSNAITLARRSLRPAARPGCSLRSGTSMHPMHGPNAFKLGIFSLNADGGLALTRVPERWLALWPDIVAVARMADACRHRVHLADRPLEGLRRRGEQPRMVL